MGVDTERVARSRPEHFGLEFPLFSSLGKQQMCGLDGKAQLCVYKAGDNFLKVTIQALFTLEHLFFLRARLRRGSCPQEYKKI